MDLPNAFTNEPVRVLRHFDMTAALAFAMSSDNQGISIRAVQAHSFADPALDSHGLDDFAAYRTGLRVVNQQNSLSPRQFRAVVVKEMTTVRHGQFVKQSLLTRDALFHGKGCACAAHAGLDPARMQGHRDHTA